jgi:hypothetical protein
MKDQAQQPCFLTGLNATWCSSLPKHEIEMEKSKKERAVLLQKMRYTISGVLV